MTSTPDTGRSDVSISFEFFPPKTPDMEGQLWAAITELTEWQPEFVSVTYGAGGSTKAPTLNTVRRMIAETPLPTASHLTCVSATREDTHRVVDELRAAGVRHFVALRGDPPGGIGTAYQPHPGGYENAAALVAGLRDIGDFEISVSAYPEKHPESRDTAADIDMLKRKADNGADRALTQFFFDNDVFETYMERVRAAGIAIPVLPGIMPIQNLTQLKRFAGMCGTSIPSYLDERFAGLDDKPEERAKVAADVAAEQIEDLVRRGHREFHLYTMNRAPLVGAVLERLGFKRTKIAEAAGAAA
ncbi:MULTISPECIES: methylenetetrahydrofolate reductase [NAD(P)H] [Rhizobium]|uniref:Methylenetetrahydrofolate reductase n=1 Tax=Rhizobium rhododendri TaxID=2506430 RepID=A0ABY8IC43_9HYPH|nr:MULTISPECIES: methylenetetrahydrofolate reductase [NAD(P)H] [Rhizobium]MBZ5758542.1 methylenetetrahydrofolate reductase [NAD(P)H] [Rhizobium sp. VS19-DR96]MBZ5764628.1 methylenetetrahydrofolate reductase [NAD(P)H] [Rhizobium sp. VS19-DR129.2]MBZ5772171.1 methylenetetrahydrofolate reductase [NAD(P)H] [Rhizobium sp. VS19-DRK62.2]MBZ5783142.1 methylenetetrahydrofolate reductase [NAD(P)H] [Rhizobium sp. VS19-DR121]MBZ5800590.1 methylenetetrahydrofolate reductase [NAD(P)H] [Rhizobium sp. VS19-DR